MGGGHVARKGRSDTVQNFVLKIWRVQMSWQTCEYFGS